MLRLKGKSLRRNADFHRLHKKYRDPESANPPWLRQLVPDEKALRELADFRDMAFHEYIEQAALQARRRRARPWLLTRLRSLGGQLARLSEHPGHEDASLRLERVGLLRV